MRKYRRKRILQTKKRRNSKLISRFISPLFIFTSVFRYISLTSPRVSQLDCRLESASGRQFPGKRNRFVQPARRSLRAPHPAPFEHEAVLSGAHSRHTLFYLRDDLLPNKRYAGERMRNGGAKQGAEYRRIRVRTDTRPPHVPRGLAP